MSKVKLTEQLFLAVLVNNIKKYAEEYSVKPSKAFKVVADVYYYWSASQLRNAESRVDRTAYSTMLYEYIFNGKSIPNKYFYLICKYHGFVAEFCELDKDYLNLIRSSVAEEQERFDKLRDETKEIRYILGHQDCIYTAELIKPLIDYYEETNEPEIFIAVHLFNYGYIMGQRAERKRKTL